MSTPTDSPLTLSALRSGGLRAALDRIAECTGMTPDQTASAGVLIHRGIAAHAQQILDQYLASPDGPPHAEVLTRLSDAAVAIHAVGHAVDLAAEVLDQTPGQIVGTVTRAHGLRHTRTFGN